MCSTDANKLMGTALVCFSLLSFEIFTARILGIVAEAHLAVFAIALAMLGMGVATSALSLRRTPIKKASAPLLLSRVAALLGLSYLLCFFCITLFSATTNASVEGVIDVGGLVALVDNIRDNAVKKLFLTGLIFSIPYFIFGIFIAKLFQSVNENEYHRFYAADLIGAALGCILVVVFLDRFGYASAFALVVTTTFLGAAAFSACHSIIATLVSAGLVVIVLAITGSPGTMSHLEPEPALSQLSRNYSKTLDVAEEWHAWNAHSRVALLSMRNPHSVSEVDQVYAHESGEGWATVPDPASPPAKWAELVTMFAPKRVLILFAGVGRDIMDVDRFCGGTCKITGVEINSLMVRHALNEGPEHIRSMLARPEIDLEVAEAREFLERDQGTYDAILLSWWGAGASHYVGTAGRLAGYMYTKEAYETLLDHLNPDGTIILFNSSKAQSLVNFREVFNERGLGGIEDRAVILREPGNYAIAAPRSFYDLLENMRLIIKPSGFSAHEMESVKKVAGNMGATLVLAPGEAAPGFEIYGDIMDGIELGQLNNRLISSHGSELSIVTDDRPFINELVPRSYYLDIGKWFESNENSHVTWNISRIYFHLVLWLGAVSTLLIMGPLVSSEGPKLSRYSIVALLYFLSLGAGFILIEVGLVRKLGLLMGNPSYSLSVVLAGLIISTGVGSLFSQRMFRSGLLTARRTAMLIVAYTIAGSLVYEIYVGAVIALPLAVKGLVILIFLFPLGFLMGQLFPQGLAQVSKVDKCLVPWAWAINSVASTVFVGVGYLLSYPLGFNSLLYAGTAFYAIIIALPAVQQKTKPHR